MGDQRVARREGATALPHRQVEQRARHPSRRHSIVDRHVQDVRQRRVVADGMRAHCRLHRLQASSMRLAQRLLRRPLGGPLGLEVGDAAALDPSMAAPVGADYVESKVKGCSGSGIP